MEAESKTGTRKRIPILVVEDEPIVAMDIRNMLDRLGYEAVDTAAQGDEAVKSAERHRPSLVLMDIMLGDELGGIAAAESIYYRFNIPIIYLTAHTDDNTLKKALETGPFGYLPKPFDERMLRTAIETGLYKHEMETKLKENEHWLSTILRNIGDAVIATDTQGNITFLNSLAEKLTGYEMQSVLKTPLHQVFQVRREAGDGQIADFSPSLDNSDCGQPQEGMLIGRNNQTTLIDYIFTTIDDQQGKVYGKVLVFRDITERKHAEEALKNHQENLKTLSARLINAQETERGRLSRELHDEIGQALTAIKINLETIKRALPSDLSSETQERIAETDHLVENLMDQIHQISLNLRPSILDDLGLVPTLKWYVSRCAQRMKIDISLTADRLQQRLPPDLETVIYRIIQEALTNVAKHAGADKVKISLQPQGNRIQVVIQDNGKGFDINEVLQRNPGNRGSGLLGIRERVELLRGEAEIQSNIDQGTLIRLSFPWGE